KSQTPLNHKHNTIEYVMGELDGRTGTDKWPNFLFRSMMSNQHFKNDFLNRMNDLMNSYFTERVVNDQIDEFVARIEDEMPFHMDRWGVFRSMDVWRMFVDKKYLFANERPQYIRQYIMEEFDIEDTITVNVGNETDGG